MAQQTRCIQPRLGLCQLGRECNTESRQYSRSSVSSKTELGTSFFLFFRIIIDPLIGEDHHPGGLRCWQPVDRRHGTYSLWMLGKPSLPGLDRAVFTTTLFMSLNRFGLHFGLKGRHGPMTAKSSMSHVLCSIIYDGD